MTNLCKKANLLSLAVAAALLATPVVASAAGGGVTNPAGAWTGGAFLGLDLPTFDYANAGPRFGGEALYGIGEIAPNLRLDVGPRVAFTYNGGDFSLWTMDFLGAGRLSYAFSPKLAGYFETGLGFGYYHVSAPNGGNGSDSGAMFDLLFAPGVLYELRPGLNLMGELGFWINAKSGLGTHIAFPTVGLQWKF